jgi:glycosyltransferase involved in cell wall biosynthesis
MVRASSWLAFVCFIAIERAIDKLALPVWGSTNMRFSIVTPSFQNSRWLRQCIASVADQNVDVEHIIQDPGSTDGTLDWLPSDPRIRLFVEKDKGMYDAINRGWRRASGDIVAHLNCDEQYLPGALSDVARFFTDNPSVDILFGDTVVVNGEGDYCCHRKVLTPSLYHSWVCCLETFTAATFFRRRVLLQHDLFFRTDMKIVADMDWAVRAIQKQVPMVALRKFTSAFTNTGDNLCMSPARFSERKKLEDAAPWWVRHAKPLIKAHHRLRRLLGGIYHQEPFDYAVYTLSSLDRRVKFHVAKPDFRWKRN